MIVSGMIVMPGGIDMHAHIAGPKVNVALANSALNKVDATNPSHRTVIAAFGHRRFYADSTFVTGYLYAGMGYTTVFDAAIPPLGARHTHEEFHDTPVIDKGFFVLVGNNQYVSETNRPEGETERLDHFLAWLLNATKGYALKVVNPGGVEAWKSWPRTIIVGLDERDR